MTETKEKTAAIVTIFRAPEMNARGRRAIAKWLRKQADLLETEGKNLSPTRYTARYLYREKTEDSDFTNSLNHGECNEDH